MRKNKIIYFLALFALSCGQQGSEAIKDSPTSGSIFIAADYEYKPITEAELSIYKALYIHTNIRPTYCTEDSAFSLLFKDSVRLIVSGRKLFPSEEKSFHDKNLFPEQVKIATDAVVLIVNNNNPDTLLSLDKIKAVFSGQDSLWKQLNSKSGLNKISIVFDYENSSNSRFTQQSLVSSHKFPSYCYALHGNPEVIDYVSKNEGAIGVIGLNWISNQYDSSVIRFLKNIRVVAIATKENPGIDDYYKPSQENLQANKYPLSRDIYIINREAYTGLGSGFLSFVTSNKGQRIVYREGLLPIREISHTIRF